MAPRLATATATEKATATVAPSPALTPTSTATLAKSQYTVRAGDTLFALAQKYGVSMAAIQLANELGESTVLLAGQTLTLPTGAQWDGESPFWSLHVVQPGETLIGIAQSFGLTTRDILRVNAIADPAQIRVGQPLVIPSDSLRVAAAPPKPTSSSAQVKPASGVSPVATPSPRPATTTATHVSVTIPGDVAAWPNTVVALINQKRAAAGLPPLTLSAQVARAAQAHANECSTRGWCSHVGADGADTRTRLIRAGYTPSSYYGENWVEALDPAQAVNWWYNETPPNDPHRKNLLNANYADIGIGIAPAEYGYYFIANFGTR